MVYRFENYNTFQTFTFEDQVPVGISNGKCMVDFREVADMILTWPDEADTEADAESSRGNIKVVRKMPAASAGRKTGRKSGAKRR